MAKGKVIEMPQAAKNLRVPVLPLTELQGESPATYHAILKSDPVNQKAYSRLMILYRREKDFKKELQTIEAAIKAMESVYTSKNQRKGTVNKVSMQLNLAFGLTDKKGRQLFDPEPIATWKKRKANVLSKLGLKK